MEPGPLGRYLLAMKTFSDTDPLGRVKSLASICYKDIAPLGQGHNLS